MDGTYVVNVAGTAVALIHDEERLVVGDFRETDHAHQRARNPYLLRAQSR